MPSPVTIRTLRAGDDLVALTALLHRAYAALASRGWNYTATSQTVEVTARRAGHGTCLLAEMDGRVVGTLSVHGPFEKSECPRMCRKGVVVLEQFAVEPDLQAHGIGKALMDEAERLAWGQGATEILGDTAQPAQHLVRWYEKLGFAVVDTVQWPGKTYRSVVLAKSREPVLPS